MENGWNGNPSRPLSRVGVLAQCRARLVSGEWPPGHVLQEKLLADELGVSKTPVREALQYLTFIGMVRPYSRIGYVVAPIDLKDMIEVFQFRTLIEEDLIHSVAAAPEPLPTASVEARTPLQAEMDFHRNLYRHIAQPRMAETLAVLLDQTSRAILHTHLEDRLLESISEEHESIEDAVRQHDAQLARALMTVHVRHLRDSLLSKLRQQLRETKNIL